jgi:tetratricopeptide (TPR) repeat protein
MALTQQLAEFKLDDGHEKLLASHQVRLTDHDQQREDERRYLEEVIQGAIDELIQRVSLNARRVLWMVTLALEPVPWFVLDNVWKATWLGKNLLEQEPDTLQKLRELVEQLSLKPRQEVLPFLETQEKFTVTEELLNKIPELDSEVKKILKEAGYIVNVPLLEPFLKELLDACLLQQEKDYEQDYEQAIYSFHELVRERCAAWVENHPQELQEFPEIEQEEKTIKPLIDEVEQEEKTIKPLIDEVYGENDVKIFNELRNLNQPNAREQATKAGKRALSYLIQARAFGKLINFISRLVINTHDPEQLQVIIRELQSIIEQVPTGETRWTLRTSLADALHQVGQLEQALPFYAQAMEEAEASKNWSSIGWIYQNWAISLRDIGQFSKARETFQLSIQAYRNVSHSEIYIMGSELELLRIDVMVGKVSKALPRIERRLSQVREWWQDSQAEESLAVTSDSEVELLARLLMGALDIAAQVHFTLEHWQEYLALLSEMELIAKIRGESEYIIAKTRFNRYGSLIKLGKLDEAQQILEECLHVFRNTDDFISQAKVLSALASVWSVRGELVKAIQLERQSLNILESLANPTNISVSHNNLSNYLHKAGQIEEGTHHRLAEMVYDIVTENWQMLEIGLLKLGIDMQEAAKMSRSYPLPHLNELLNHPEFRFLRQFLEQRNINLKGLQASIDELVTWVYNENKIVVH